MENKTGGKVKLPPLGQVGVVVKDLNKAMEYYSAVFGMGPWKIVESDFPAVQVRDKTVPWKLRVALTQLGPVELELMQILAGRSIHSEFLDQGREGLHHLGFFVSSVEEKELLTEELSKRGVGIIQSGITPLRRVSFAYLDSEKIGGVIFELLHRPPQ